MFTCHLAGTLIYGICASAGAESRLEAEAGAYQPRPVGATVKVTAAERRGHQEMLRNLEKLRSHESITNSYYGTGKLTEARQRWAAARSEEEKMHAGLGLMFAAMDLGEETIALEAMAAVEEKFERDIDRINPNAAAEILFRFGLIQLRHGETQNCCLLHNADSCLLPLRGGGVHTRPEGAEAAVSYFKRALQFAEPGSDRYLETVWLLNLASMALDQHPRGVPEEYRIAPERFLSGLDFPRLMNVAGDVGLDTNSLCGSVVADDFNNDGHHDLMVSSWDLREPMRLFINDGSGRYLDRAEEAGLSGLTGGLNMVQGDYNNDGWLDVYILRGAWLFADGHHPDSLLRNNGDGTFTDVTLAAGLAERSYPSQTAAWADYDLDGHLDLYVGGEEGPENSAPGRLFRNNGDGTFRNVAEVAGVTNGRLAKGVTWGDYNADRYPDLYVSNLGSPNRLYRNKGDGTFSDVAWEAGVADVSFSFPTWFWDFDNDGILDLFVAAFDAQMDEVARHYLGRPESTGIPRLFRGTPGGTFVDAAREMGLKEPTLPMGSNFGDLDNDGFLDFYLGTGSPEYKMITPNKFYWNQSGERFLDISETAGLSHLQKGHGVAFVDLDTDGDQDLFIQMGGAYPVDKYLDGLYENPGFGNFHIEVELVGVRSNRFGQGARIRVDLETNGQPRSIHRVVNSGGSFGCNPLRQQIGVGKAERVKRLEVYWPVSDKTQSFVDLPVNCIVRITEGESAHEVMKLPPIHLTSSEGR